MPEVTIHQANDSKDDKAANKAVVDDQKEFYLKEREKSIDNQKAENAELNLQLDRFKIILSKMDKEIKTVRQVKTV